MWGTYRRAQWGGVRTTECYPPTLAVTVHLVGLPPDSPRGRGPPAATHPPPPLPGTAPHLEGLGGGGGHILRAILLSLFRVYSAAADDSDGAPSSMQTVILGPLPTDLLRKAPRAVSGS